MQRPSLPSLSRCPCSCSCDQSAIARKSRLQPRESRSSWAPAQQQRRYLMHTLTLTLDQAEHIDFLLQTWLADAMSGGQWQLAFNYPTECVWALEAHYWENRDQKFFRSFPCRARGSETGSWRSEYTWGLAWWWGTVWCSSSTTGHPPLPHTHCSHCQRCKQSHL